ncbi:MAG TPA: ATP-binding protein [Roseiflexaceae bacterium]|nr:ATP-binding protein [Roseiflexaceae bacterium]
MRYGTKVMSTLNEFAPQPDGAELLAALQELALRLTQTLERPAVVQQVVEWLAEQGFGAAVVAPPSHTLLPLVEAHAAPMARAAQQLRQALERPGEPRFVDQLVSERETWQIELNASQPFVDLAHLGESFHSVIGYPLVWNGQALGTLVVALPTPALLMPSMLRTLDLLARQVSLVLYQAEAQSQIDERLSQYEQRYSRLRRAYELVTSERRILAEALEAASDAVLITEESGSVQFGNPAVELALGIHPDLLIGHILHDADIPEQLSSMLQRARVLEQTEEGELSLDDGRTLHVSISPVRPLDGPIYGYVTLLRDITHFKQLDEMKSRFVSTVSHDLKSPLSIMHGYIELLETERPLDENQRHYVDRIKSTLQRLVALVSDLLDLGRLEAHIGIEKNPCDLRVVVQSQIETYRLKAAAKGITLIEPLAADLPPVSGDIKRLQQVLGNLLGNAITYTPVGGRVAISMRVRESHMVVSISDTGVGIDPHELPQLFEPFFRASSGRRMNGDGTGLGLAIVKRIIEEHGGTISVESTLGVGSTFRFAIPLAAT